MGHKITILKSENNNPENPEDSDELKTIYQKDWSNCKQII